MTGEEQKRYDFRLMGEEILRGRNAYHISFIPKNKNVLTWSGEAFMDVTFQPVGVFTSLPRRFRSWRAPSREPTCPAPAMTSSANTGRWDLVPSGYGAEYELHLFFHHCWTVSVSVDTLFDLAKTAAMIRERRKEKSPGLTWPGLRKLSMWRFICGCGRGRVQPSR
jgi:hypothetical protein